MSGQPGHSEVGGALPFYCVMHAVSCILRRLFRCAGVPLVAVIGRQDVTTSSSDPHATPLAFSDPASIPPPPPGSVGFPNREPSFDTLPGFRQPPPGYGEVPFYWWLGDPLSRERIAWQIERLKDCGVEGLQVNYAHSDTGGQFWGLSYPSDPPLFTEEWWNLYQWFLQEAKKNDMAVSLSDYTLGVGQGSFMDDILRDNPELTGATLKHATWKHTGGSKLALTLPDHTLSATAYRLDGEAVAAGTGVDLRPHVAGQSLRWSAPAGEWLVVAVSAVGHPLSVDPLHPLCGEKYIEKFFQRFEDRNPGEAGKALNFFFSDELNFGVGGNLWSPGFAAEFLRRKGYDIIPELPALFLDTGPRTPKVRLDFSDVKIALEEEYFFRPVFEWHQRRGMIYGCDHGGRGRDVTEFGDYFRTQRWNQGPGCDQPNLEADIIKNKVASSIAHLYLRPRTWLEGFHSSGWGTTSGQVADATFRNFVGGHNLLTLHGLYYSTHGGWWEWAPPCNHFRMTYWDHLRAFLRCSERLSFILSQGHHRCDVAILYPVAPAEACMEGHAAVTAAFSLGEHIFRAGLDFDFMDFESLDRAEACGRELRVSGEAYRVLVLPAMQAVRFSTLRKAAEFFRAGGIVVSLGALPRASDRAGRDDAELDALVREIFGRTAEEADGVKELSIRRNPAGGAGVLAQSPEQVEDFIGKAFPRDFACPAGSAQVHHRRIGPRDLYMVYGARQHAECEFRATGKAELWDPWTGQTRPLPILSQAAGSTRLSLPLDANEAQLVVFSPGKPALATARPAAPAEQALPIDGLWECELKPTMDNTWGDFRWPPTPAMIGAEARQLRYADEASPNPGWENPGTDDSGWPLATCGFGPKFWKLGPLPENVDVAGLEQELAALQDVDPSVPVDFNGVQYPWQPYSFSWRWGLEKDPGHQGYHGLKEETHDEFIALGKLDPGWKGDPSYGPEAGGTRYYLWTSVPAPRDMKARRRTGAAAPSAMWLNHVPAATGAVDMPLKSGSNPLLLRYDKPAYTHLLLEDPARTGVTAGVPFDSSSRTMTTSPMATTWHREQRHLPFDTRPQQQPAGWYRFTSPPGMRQMRGVVQGSLRAWADGRAMQVSYGPQREDGAREFAAVAAEPAAGSVAVALRVAQERGCYAGAALPEPIALDCDPGLIAAGDWSQIDGLRSYSGGIWYRTTVTLTPAQVRKASILNLGQVSSSAEVRVNGRSAGVRVASPWVFDVAELLKAGENRIEILVYNTLANHYTTIPTRYRGNTLSGLMGPVRLE